MPLNFLRYNLLPNPTGPSATDTVCPRFSPLGEFTNNRAHSNMFYGLRIHPEFYPTNGFCGSDLDNLNNKFNQVPASFNGLTSYKNGMKGAIATQVWISGDQFMGRTCFPGRECGGEGHIFI